MVLVVVSLRVQPPSIHFVNFVCSAVPGTKQDDRPTHGTTHQLL